MQQSLAEYKFNQNTDFICYCRVPGIASNILRNVSLQFTEIFYLHLHLYTLRLQKNETGFLKGFKTESTRTLSNFYFQWTKNLGPG